MRAPCALLPPPAHRPHHHWRKPPLPIFTLLHLGSVVARRTATTGLPLPSAFLPLPPGPKPRNRLGTLSPPFRPPLRVVKSPFSTPKGRFWLATPPIETCDRVRARSPMVTDPIAESFRPAYRSTERFTPSPVSLRSPTSAGPPSFTLTRDLDTHCLTILGFGLIPPSFTFTLTRDLDAGVRPNSA